MEVPPSPAASPSGSPGCLLCITTGWARPPQAGGRALSFSGPFQSLHSPDHPGSFHRPSARPPGSSLLLPKCSFLLSTVSLPCWTPRAALGRECALALAAPLRVPLFPTLCHCPALHLVPQSRKRWTRQVSSFKKKTRKAHKYMKQGTRGQMPQLRVGALAGVGDSEVQRSRVLTLGSERFGGQTPKNSSTAMCHAPLF